MSDTKNTDDKSTSMAPKKTLTLSRRTVEQGTVKQSFSHGRTKAVVVETKKSRKHGEGGPLEGAQSTQTAQLHLFVFLGAPYVERLRHNQHWTAALTGITAAVVGVIAIRSDDTGTIAPVQTNPDTEPAPTLATEPPDTSDIVIPDVPDYSHILDKYEDDTYTSDTTNSYCPQTHFIKPIETLKSKVFFHFL